MVTLLGPSGCGKTTTLRCVAGLERPTGGQIAVGEQAVVNMEKGVFVPPHLRNLGMVFQSYAIWPHMTVFENVAYALEGRKMSKADAKKLTMDALETVQLAGHADRPAPRLSGGQQQRVAIARAIVGKPQALLFDEPLSNLDAKLRVEMRTELRRLQKQIGLTSIYVTHDQAEALAISDWIIVMKDGKIVERGRPTQIYRYPENVFTAQFIGTTNLIPGTVKSVDGEQVGVETAFGRTFLALLRHQAHRVRLVAQSDRQHLLGRRHLKIERHLQLGHEPGDVVVGNMASVFAQVRRDSVRPRFGGH